jgi:CubicO group peptidase (beta-lactamase class C family)
MNIRLIVVSIILVLIVGFFSANSSSTKNINVENESPKSASINMESKIALDRFPDEITKDVRYKLDSLLERINKRHDFHGAVLVSKNGRVVYNNQVGYADFRNKTKLNEESVFQLASVSKQFTAAAIMLLNERCLLQLSDVVTDYYPDFPYEDVTIENLLNHTAGLPNYYWVAEHKWEREGPPTNSEMMTLLESSDVLRYFKPGRNFDYSNTAYFVLASIVERVSGTSFKAFLRANIFEPLQMNNSYVYSFEKDSIEENQLSGYRLYRGWRHLKINGTVNDAIVGDKNVYATIEDLYRWIRGLNSGTLLSEESLDLMYSRGETIYGRKVPYGYGFRIDPRDQNIIYHHGKWNGFSTGLTQYLDDELVVIVLEHTSYNAMKSLNRKIRAIVSENFEGEI